MATICSICGKKQSGFITDFPLSQELNRNRICGFCYEKKNTMLKNAAIYNDLYIQARDYFINIIIEQKPSDEVKRYIEEFIECCDQQKEIYSKKENEKLYLIEQEKERERILKNRIENFLMTSGFNFERHNITRYNKVICAEAVLGTGFLSEFSSSIADLLGVESQLFTLKLEEARNIATHRLITKAIDLNANAIIGIDFDYTMFGNNIVGVIVNGTAVTVEAEQV